MLFWVRASKASRSNPCLSTANLPNPGVIAFTGQPYRQRVQSTQRLLKTGLPFFMVEDAGIRRLLGKARDPAEAVDMLVQQALDNGGQDNVTALCLWAGGGKRRFRRKLWGPRARAGAQER